MKYYEQREGDHSNLVFTNNDGTKLPYINFEARNNNNCSWNSLVVMLG